MQKGHLRASIRLAAALALLLGLASPALAVDQTFETEQATIRVQTFADGLTHPWGLAFLPDGRMLVTERPGRLRIVSPDGAVSQPIDGVPQVHAQGQGGLLDVALHPRFEANRLVYLSYAEPGPGGSGTAVARARLEDGEPARLAGLEVIFRQEPKLSGNAHYGSRLVFDNDGRLWVTLGERRARDMAQELDNHIGKVVRLNDDGSVPDDNPFVGEAGARPEIWSYGHRNPQGMALHPQTGIVWTHEHGPRGGDEVNIPRRGANHGWPLATYGTEYSGAVIFEGDRFPPGLVEPLHHWTPSIAPSGMAFYSGDAIPEWQGDLLVGALAGQRLVRLELDGERAVREEHMLQPLGLRLRDVRVGSDGAVYVLTDQEAGEILRITSGGEQAGN